MLLICAYTFVFFVLTHGWYGYFTITIFLILKLNMSTGTSVIFVVVEFRVTLMRSHLIIHYLSCSTYTYLYHSKIMCIIVHYCLRFNRLISTCYDALTIEYDVRFHNNAELLEKPIISYSAYAECKFLLYLGEQHGRVCRHFYPNAINHV